MILRLKLAVVYFNALVAVSLKPKENMKVYLGVDKRTPSLSQYF